MGGKLFNRVKACVRNQCRLKLVNVNSIIANVKSVFFGIKSSYLLDQFSCTPEKFLELVTIIAADSDIYPPKLCRILYFENGDIFLADVKHCLDIIKQALEKLDQNSVEYPSNKYDVSSVVINVTEALSEPELYFSTSKTIQEKVKNVYINTLNLLMQHFDSESVHSLHSTDRITIYRCCMPAFTNLCTVYGILLNYPFIYWFDEESSHSTCINMTELHVTKMSIPAFYNCSDEATDETLCEIYSFSVPESLLLNLSAKRILENWKSKIIAKVEMKFNACYAIKEFCITVPCLSC